MLERALRDFRNGMSAVISLTGWREKKNSPLAPRAQSLVQLRIAVWTGDPRDTRPATDLGLLIGCKIPAIPAD
jgi:hypothetical protein